MILDIDEYSSMNDLRFSSNINFDLKIHFLKLFISMQNV